MLFTGKKGFGANVKFVPVLGSLHSPFFFFRFRVAASLWTMRRIKRGKKNKQTRERGEGAMKVMKINGVRPKMG